ncbi:class I adenylate-forming enzyme family protein [Roseovarius atlanticus]|uniref:class I adenylate-forming enzyme family protein n=1 Tax=Roseovarius atlanticus TaxID=1641875 RepID=UPI001C951B30|nr:class I adenylate-forming enzyme family protein [Roseovarius atlanticus]MBY5987302.1 acyl--CoA ligase [Roseovarius atlanticus]MBY6125942.1 acyl--CoA ligase [Roseovarius atlanticus]MBY6149598.1 acyl--CoA ligase [Roseovarius atlanticus]
MTSETAAAPAPDFYTMILSAVDGAVVDDVGRLPMSDLQHIAHSTSRRLTAAGLKPAEPVLIPVSSRAEDVAAILGAIGAGAVAVPLHHRAHTDTVQHIQEVTGARFALETKSDTQRAAPGLCVSDQAAPAPRPLLDGAAMVTFTSGSTGKPKGVVLSRTRISGKFQAIRTALAMPASPVAAVPLQLQFSFGQWATFIPLMQGGTVHMTGRYSNDWMANLIRSEQLTYMAAVPTMLRMLVGTTPGNQAIEILTGGEAVSAHLRRLIFCDWPRATIHSLFGLTETGTCDLLRTDRSFDDDRESIGYPTPGVAVAVDPETGELVIKSPFGMLGYLDMPDVTDTTLRNGWLKTGDKAEILADGEVVLSGRLKELINRGGNKVSPLEVEAVFAEHPDISATLVTGVPDSRLGEAIHLMVVLQGDRSLTCNDLINWARPRTERFKLPDTIHFASALPLGQTGKADRAAMRREILERS